MADPAPAEAGPLEADNGEENDNTNDDSDSAMGVSVLGSSASMTSSIMRYREENGRTYHAYREGRYVLPNDAVENDRLDLQHHLYTLTFDGKLFVSPAGRDKPLKRVLDAGTGTGIWAMDFADDHQETLITGVDLSPIQPPFVPPNVTFYIDDLEDDWTYSYKFDFVFGRMLTGSIADWPRFIRQSYEYLEPGGWIELSDILLDLQSDDGTVRPECATQKWAGHMLEAAAIWKRPLDSCKFYKEQLAEAGFTNIEEKIYKWPSNPWPKDPKYKELGVWTYENLGNGLSGLSLALFTRALGWSAEQLEVFLVDARKDMRDRSIHGWWPVYVVYAQKPE
ncbi:methyltransferase domain-containing protein [Colletotrichum scovillei]|uniref:Methyltransferase domain-containing protein n=2 Tax=Colletotrichum scovillei TaxID=1209932 RepID=A0A9P7QTF5_9PEZI|nr:methyltransferase domain-containing protein [Colletotrichum scovillei]KAG7040803.1 methyltransferase domain-containing protein [Colletotrichum scovillei]KAG7060847.1 methyltransferase domain-containing protein [Colletotrichum scovillei]